MNSYFVKTPNFIKTLFSEAVWSIETKDKKIYLSFDDGPIPEITPWILDQLKSHKANASFFCVGENITKHRGIFDRIKSEGHSIGNHTYNHLNGWKTKNSIYFENIKKTQELTKSRLFRPPYGKMSRSQYLQLKKEFQIVMWDVLSGDFDTKISKEKCYSNIIKNSRKGSIIVLHDNIKSIEKLKYVLPKTLKHFTEKGYRFCRIV